VIRSMTGFGRAEGAGPTFVLTVEVKSVNHRHLDIAVRLPSVLAELELPARRVVQGRLERGRVDVAVQLTPQRGPAAVEVLVDAALARRYVEQARALAGELGLDDEPPLAWVLEQPGVVQTAEAARPEPETVGPVLEDTLGRALDELVARRTAEGAALAAELRARRSELLGLVAAMSARAPQAAARRLERLRERVRALAGDVGVDESRLAAEVALWAQKTDISEELTRLGAHLDELGLVLDKGGPVGRPLDFLIQELNREVNTLAAKADDLELSQAALAAKGILEKMREQVQNLE
jgi:uncharacterized protein (TIGR00255 family)